MSDLSIEVAKPMVEAMVIRVAEEIRFLRGLENELNELGSKIKSVASIVGKMNATPYALVEEWLRKAVGIINNAENVFDLLAYQEHRGVVIRRRSKKAFKGKIRLIFAPLEKVFIRIKIGRRIRSITCDFEDALKRAENINQLKTLAAPSSDPSSSQPEATAMSNYEILQQVRTNVDMSTFVGRESDVDTVAGMLCNSSQQNHHLSVVAIVGIGGLGKTSLARKVYENERVRSHFSKRLWISEIKDINIKMVLSTMLEYVGMGNEIGSTDTAIRKLGKCLGAKRYLLVMDDVWNTHQDSWNSLRFQLETIGGALGSMVLTTTRDDVVARTMCASSVHHLQKLSKDDSWSLFQQIAFANKLNGDGTSALLKASGKKIVVKCKGVPLAIKSIAGLLQGKTDPLQWTRIKESELWDIPLRKTGILPSLKLSYDHLSSPLLKKCFSLCATWPRGTRFEKYEIRSRWIALGLVQKPYDENFTLEDKCEDYINELLRISFLTVHETNEVGEAIKYILHDLVYDVARSVSMHERLYWEKSKKGKQDIHRHQIQYLSLYGHVEVSSDFPDNLVLENIRSLDAMDTILPKGLLEHVKYLRVLSLERSNVEELPETLGSLKCLKYLDLAENPIKVLPECIMNLYNLQSLILYRCDQLAEFHRGRLGNLVSLRHLGLSFDFCPTKGVIQQLTQLHTIPPMQLSEGGFQINELGYLQHIRGKLEVKGLEFVKSKLDAKKANLSKKQRVEQLLLSWNNDDICTNYEEVLDGLYPHKYLKLLSIKGYAGDKFPSWLMKMDVSEEHNSGYAYTLCNLIHFELVDCERCQRLPTLGHLPSLKKIVITNMQNLEQIGPEIYNDCGADSLTGNENQKSSSSSGSTVKSFASLKEVEIRHLGNLVEWCEPDPIASVWSGFPSLEKLLIEKCVKLERMPNEFPSLRELTLKSIKNGLPVLNIMRNKRSLSCLKKLHIEWVFELTEIPEELGECTSLQTLTIRRCKKLSRLPEKLSKLVSLEVLIIRFCPKLVSIPNMSGLGLLREFELLRNDGLRGVPDGLQSCKSLEKLWIARCEKVETLPDMVGLGRLSNLNIIGMTKMIRPPDWMRLYSLPCLQSLHIGTYKELNEFPDLSPLLNIISLQNLLVYGWEKLHSIPEQLQHFTNLMFLAIYDFKNVEQLPDWLGNLSSLQNLRSGRCKELKKLPSEDAMKRLTNLRLLEIEDCPLLEEATKINGPEYHKIAAVCISVIIKNSTN